MKNALSVLTSFAAFVALPPIDGCSCASVNLLLCLIALSEQALGYSDFARARRKLCNAQIANATFSAFLGDSRMGVCKTRKTFARSVNHGFIHKLRRCCWLLRRRRLIMISAAAAAALNTEKSSSESIYLF
jgi:hypothetical protein